MEYYPTFRWAILRFKVHSYFILTRLPLTSYSAQETQNKLSNLCRTLSPFDLHVLGIPPAFILSHDQTLSTKIVIFVKKITKKDFF